MVCFGCFKILYDQLVCLLQKYKHKQSFLPAHRKFPRDGIEAVFCGALDAMEQGFGQQT